MPLLPISKGYSVTVDAQDVKLLSAHKWSANVNGAKVYAVRTVKRNGIKRKIYMHRMILEATAGVEVDHLNGNGLDNRRCNLRLCTSQQNKWNKSCYSASGYKGVIKMNRPGKKIWSSRIFVNGTSYFLGNWEAAEDAAIAYDVAAQLFFAEYARLNFPRTFPHD